MSPVRTKAVALKLVYVLMIFCFSDAPTTGFYTLSLHDALPIFGISARSLGRVKAGSRLVGSSANAIPARSEEHTSELQSRLHLVCRLLLEKKKRKSLPALARKLYRPESRIQWSAAKALVLILDA